MKFKLLAILACCAFTWNVQAQSTAPQSENTLYGSQDYTKVFQKYNYAGTRTVNLPQDLGSPQGSVRVLNLQQQGTFTQNSIKEVQDQILNQQGKTFNVDSLSRDLSGTMSSPDAFMATLLGLAAVGGDGSGFLALFSGVYKPFDDCLEKVGKAGNSYTTNNPIFCYLQHVYPLMNRSQSLNLEKLSFEMIKSKQGQ